jgi:ribonuclease BN (tRNA processing enzyme)
VTSGSKIFCYSGDTPDCAGLRKTCQKADLAIIETSWPKTIKVISHLTGEQVGKIASDCQVKKLILTHVAPYYLKNFNVIKDVKENYQGPVALAKDLMKIKI